MAGNQIYRGPIDRQPITVNKPVAGAYLPGTIVEPTATQLVQVATPFGKLLRVLGNVDFKDQDVNAAYVTGDTGIGFEPCVNDIFQCRVAAATYTKNQELTVNATGRLAAAVSTNLVVAFYDDVLTARAADALSDVIWANAYVKP